MRWWEDTSAEGLGDGGSGPFLTTGENHEKPQSLYWEILTSPYIYVGMWYQVIFDRFLPDNFIPSGVSVVNTAKVVLLKVGF